MPDIYINVSEKTAKAAEDAVIVCGNSDYILHFTFDGEWDTLPLKTMRVVWRTGDRLQYVDVLFDGSSVALPAVFDTYEIAVGVYAGSIHTTTQARFRCARCVLDISPMHSDPPPDIYEQILEYLANISQGEPFAVSDVFPVSNGGAAADIFAIAEEE